MDSYTTDFVSSFDDEFGSVTPMYNSIPSNNCCMALDFSSMAMQTLTGMSSSRVSNSIGNMMTKEQIYQYENENGFLMWADGFLDRFVSTLSILRPSSVIVAIDCKGNNWRKDIYSDYKFGRKTKSGYLSSVDFDLFAKAKIKMIEYLRNIGMLCIEVDRAEADDILYCIARAKDNTVIVSCDGDMNQLAKWGAKIYNPVKRSFVEDMDAKFFLEIKTIMGDGGDFIHSIRGSITDKKAVWPVTLYNAASSVGVLNYLLENESENKDVIIPLPSGDIKLKMSDIYIRNKSLIDMEYIPQDIINSIMEKWGHESLNLKYDKDSAALYNIKYIDIIARYVKMI